MKEVSNIDVSYVDWNGNDNWKSIKKLILECDSGVYSAHDEDGNLCVVYVQKGDGVKRVTWVGNVGIEHYYDYFDGDIVFSESFEIDKDSPNTDV